MSSNLSTESPTDTSGNVGTGGTLKDLKTDFANLLINRVSLGECLNVIRDACVARAADLVDEELVVPVRQSLPALAAVAVITRARVVSITGVPGE